MSSSELLNDQNVRRWHDNVARGSKITADVYLRRLAAFCRSSKITPRELASLESKRIYDLLLDMVTEMEKQGKAGGYISSSLKAIKSWLSYNDIQVNRKIKIRGAQETPTLKEEKVPTREELRRIFLSADLRQRTACVFMAHSGLRPEVLGNYDGTDGLKVGDLPEIVIDSQKVTFSKIPAIVRVRSSLSKAGHEFFTFLTEEGCQYVSEYLESRMREGESIGKDTPVIMAKKDAGRENGGFHITTTNISRMVRKAIKTAGFNLRPYVLRSYFDTQLMIAESRGYMLRDYRSFFMGHKGDIENRYTTNKHRLPEELIEEMRESFRKSSDLLQTFKKEALDQAQVEAELKRQLLKISGYTDEEIDALDISNMNDKDIQKMIREKLFGASASRQVVIPVEEIKAYLSKGFEFVAALPNDEAIVKGPL
ncbi:MAG: site-specific integrase [Nitrososphaerota archaeon]|jgi:hypothetical protein|nr:site-specific integrase [Nitrososphaerota archaeon]MDG6932709.1 site-specific integrase [Nitrososphaerota archaeon]MDG6935505.1 site-specific integrase [Nitrososphaerota archaeon]MDG6943400.1 site-specific integrase [Nitrososphaerota archaeon]